MNATVLHIFYRNKDTYTLNDNLVKRYFAKYKISLPSINSVTLLSEKKVFM